MDRTKTIARTSGVPSSADVAVDQIPPREAASVAADEINQPIGAVPMSRKTGLHDPGTGADETMDGLSDTEEMTREMAEDVPTPNPDADDELPVFDRADALPKL